MTAMDVHPRTADEVERRRGHEAAKRWLVHGESEMERASLAAALSGGLTVLASRRLYPTLLEAIGGEWPDEGVAVDFAATPWLRGFRDAIVEELGEPG